MFEQSVKTVSTMFRLYAKKKIILVCHFHLVAGMGCYLSVHDLPRASFNFLDVKFVVFGRPLCESEGKKETVGIFSRLRPILQIPEHVVKVF